MTHLIAQAARLDPDTYALHDVTQYPLVLTRRPHASAGAVQAWARDMDRLAGGTTPFVLIATDLNVDLSAADRRDMVAWQASNMARLRRYCAGFVSIVPDPRAFGLPFFAVPTLAQARDRARELLVAFAGGRDIPHEPGRLVVV